MMLLKKQSESTKHWDNCLSHCTVFNVPGQISAKWISYYYNILGPARPGLVYIYSWQSAKSQWSCNCQKMFHKRCIFSFSSSHWRNSKWMKVWWIFIWKFSLHKWGIFHCGKGESMVNFYPDISLSKGGKSSLWQVNERMVNFIRRFHSVRGENLHWQETCTLEK